MFSFRQKVFIAYLVVLLAFLAVLSPFVSHSVQRIVRNSLEQRAVELITRVETAPNLAGLIDALRAREAYLFFRVSLIDAEGRVLYESRIVSPLPEEYEGTPADYLRNNPEIGEAFQHGTGYAEGYSYRFKQKLAYMAKEFIFHGERYVLRIAFPLPQIEEVSRDIELGFLTLGAVVLVLFSVLSWTVIYHLSRPIQKIILAVKPYQEGLQDHIPEIDLGRMMATKDDFVLLAQTLNSLSKRITHQINTLTSERNEKEAILESLVEGVVAVDKQMQVTYANQMSLKILGMERLDFVGQPLDRNKHPRYFELLSQCQTKNQVLSETVHMEGKPKLVFDVVVAPKAEEGGAILVLQDKTSHYRMIEIGKDFVANASHELKTPITIIRGFAETLHDHPEISREMSQEITAKIVRNCGRMDKMIRNLLALANLEKLPLSRLQECSLLEVVDNCCPITESMYPSAKIEVYADREDTYTLIGDPDLLEQAVTNLLDNAAKYSDGPARIDITLERAGPMLQLRVADQGIGIPADDLDHIFQRFYTVSKAESRRLGGSGLGLSIVQTIVEKHHGSVSVQSEVGVGSLFTILLPAHLDDTEI